MGDLNTHTYVYIANALATQIHAHVCTHIYNVMLTEVRVDKRAIVTCDGSCGKRVPHKLAL